MTSNKNNKKRGRKMKIGETTTLHFIQPFQPEDE
jgi:hypothetical protein